MSNWAPTCRELLSRKDLTPAEICLVLWLLSFDEHSALSRSSGGECFVSNEDIDIYQTLTKGSHESFRRRVQTLWEQGLLERFAWVLGGLRCWFHISAYPLGWMINSPDSQGD